MACSTRMPLLGGWERYQNKDINNDILVSYGYGDGGGGPTRRNAGDCPCGWKRASAGMPKVRQCLALAPILRSWRQRVAGNKRLPGCLGGRAVLRVPPGHLYLHGAEQTRQPQGGAAHDGPGAAERAGCGPAALPGGRTGRHVENHPAQSVPRYSSRLIHS